MQEIFIGEICKYIGYIPIDLLINLVSGNLVIRDLH